MTDINDIAARLKAARKNAGFKTAIAAAESLGVPYATYSQHENGTRGLTTDASELYARRYRVSLDWLLTGKGDGPGYMPPMGVAEEPPQPPERRATRPNASFPPIYTEFPKGRSIPVLGQTEAGPNGKFVLNGAEVARVFCPPELENVPNAYAVRVYGTSMEPRFKAGETVWLNPQLPVRHGDDVVVQLKPMRDGDEMESYVKEFRAKSSRRLQLWQHNPEEGESRELDFDTERVFSIHKIVHHSMI